MSRNSCHSENYSLWQIPLHQSLSIKRRNHTVRFKTAPNLNGSTTTSPFLHPTCTFSLLLSVALHSLPVLSVALHSLPVLSVALHSLPVLSVALHSLPVLSVALHSLPAAEYGTTVTVSLLLSVALQFPCC